MEGDVGIISEDVKHGEEVNIEEEWAKDRALGDTVGYRSGQWCRKRRTCREGEYGATVIVKAREYVGGNEG